MGERRLLGHGRLAGERVRLRFLAVVEIQDRIVAGDAIGLGEPGMRILGDRSRDRQRALDQPLQARPRAIARGHDRLPPADEHAQAEIGAFRALDILELAQAPARRLAAALDQHGVGRIGAGASGPGQEIGQKVDGVVGIGHGKAHQQNVRAVA